MGVPLYRQEKIWDDKGLVLPRNMMAIIIAASSTPKKNKSRPLNCFL